MFESVNRVNATKWWRQIVPSARSSHSERAVTEWWRSTWLCDRARRGGSEACSGGDVKNMRLLWPLWMLQAGGECGDPEHVVADGGRAAVWVRRAVGVSALRGCSWARGGNSMSPGIHITPHERRHSDTLVRIGCGCWAQGQRRQSSRLGCRRYALQLSAQMKYNWT